MHKIIATGLGIGYIGKGSGSVAAMCCCVIWYLSGGNSFSSMLVTIAIIAMGVWSAGVVEQYWGVDSHRVVIDEIAGMCVSLLFLPVKLKTIVFAFILFRFFDIVKPLYIREAESLPKGWGVMADDVVAGLYTNLILRLALLTSII